LNILLVSDVSIHDVIGGAERVLYEQSTRLAKRGHSVHILTRRLPEHKSDNETIENVREWRFRVDQSNAMAFLISTLRCSRTLFESVNRHNLFDCINFHQPFSSLGVIRSSMSRKIKKIYTCHSLSHEEYQSRNKILSGIVRKSLYQLNVQGRKLIEKKVLDTSDRIIVLSRFTQDKLWNTYRIPPDRIVVIPGGVDLKRFYPVMNRLDIRRRLGIPGKSMVLLTVRNLVPRMGLENLIQALKHVVEDLPDTLLIIGGSGPLKDTLVKYAQTLGMQDHIRFAGFISGEDLPDYYRAADVFILPTLELEGFGLVTLEALASGTPVLGTPVGGTKEILGRLDSRYLFRDTTPEAIAELIMETCLQFKDNPSLWQNLSSRCRKFVEAYYSWEENVNTTEKLFLEILSESQQ
jgi:glycosyltransferase involved in cell wall biosynthesis